MTRYTLLVNASGRILSFRVHNPDPQKFPAEDLTGRHLSRLIGFDCWSAIGWIRKQIARTRQPGRFSTIISSHKNNETSVLDWIIRPKGRTFFFQRKYLLSGTEQQ